MCPDSLATVSRWVPLSGTGGRASLADSDLGPLEAFCIADMHLVIAALADCYISAFVAMTWSLFIVTTVLAIVGVLFKAASMLLLACQKSTYWPAFTHIDIQWFVANMANNDLRMRKPILDMFINFNCHASYLVTCSFMVCECFGGVEGRLFGTALGSEET